MFSRNVFIQVFPLFCFTLSVATPTPQRQRGAPAIFQIPQTAWDSLNQTVQGRLYKGAPIGLPCYFDYDDGTGSKSSSPDPVACAAVSINSTDSPFIVSRFGGYVTTNFATCMTSNQGCPLDVGNQLSGTCEQGSVPNYYIDVRQPSDVAAGLAFVKAHNIPLVVKNSGHDYKGRSSGQYSLALWTHNVQPPIKVDKSFVPEVCNASSGPTLTYGAGQGFQGLFQTAHDNGYMFVGGTSPTVGASGGWLTGGGHSALSPIYGMGVDNVEQIRVVLPNGTYVTANRCQNTDLFFALRGGGGNAFGVVMETTSRMHLEVPLQSVQIIAPTLAPSAQRSLISLIVKQTPQWARDDWGGYIVVGEKGISALALVLITPKLTLEQAKVSMQPAMDFAHSFGNLSIPVVADISTLQGSYWEYYNDVAAQFLSMQGVGSGESMASRLVPRANFEDPAKAEELINTLVDILNNAASQFGVLLVTPSDYELPASDQQGGSGEASVTPAWRDSYWHTIFQTTWSSSDETYGGFGSASGAFNGSTTSADRLRAITPGSGAYQNEGDTFEPDPADSFWGLRNYDRLMKIKSELDPDNILTCHQCIGWDKTDPRWGCYPNLEAG